MIHATLENIFVEYKFTIIVVVAILVILLFLYLAALCMHKKGQNFIIFSLALIFVDFTFDCLFFLNNAKDVKSLYLPSLLVLAIPAMINFASALYIMVYERINNPRFQNWLYDHSTFAAIITVCSSANIQAIRLIYSELFNCEIFKAGISIKSNKWIMWISVLDAIIEDIPHFVIQLLYHKSQSYYSVIPFFTLVSSVISLLVAILGRFYDALNASEF
ncbi:3115_t:CDS:2 [Acaulospora morrowiae]|uniref:3115_t:CDS:1 n=1 Tax=Acaulospora morrowiae TaxID=94023 RepID=A0A9N9GR43_9GLOM|nr:3115_t:CDS:2 [Acaulospora morrowiae]